MSVTPLQHQVESAQGIFDQMSQEEYINIVSTFQSLRPTVRLKHAQRLQECDETSPLTWLLELIGQDAADKVGSSASQGAHQLVQLFLLYTDSEKTPVRW